MLRVCPSLTLVDHQVEFRPASDKHQIIVNRKPVQSISEFENDKKNYQGPGFRIFFIQGGV